ncbi:MAG: hypothetical protein Q9170_005980 [Blastenia crenularia]
MKDNNLGLGAKNGSHGDENSTTGLDGLRNLLGRLNGKGEELLEKEQRGRQDSRRTIYAERRWGSGNFVSGGFLVGDRIEDTETGCPEISDSAPRMGKVKSKALPDNGVSKKKKTRRIERESEPDALPRQGDLASPADLGTKQSDEKAPYGGGERQARCSKSTDDNAVEAQKSLEKLERKKRRRARKAEHLASKTSKQQEQRPSDSLPTHAGSGKQVSVAESQAVMVGPSHCRHAVRQRFIQYKKMSMMDERALNEV